MSHPPLCRVARGPKVTVGPLEPPPDLKISTDLQDSCYSSCSESEHSSLSRNTSAASETLGQEGNPWDNDSHYQKLLDFAVKLGYAEEQLQNALGSVKGPWPPNQDQVLGVLIRQTQVQLPSCVAETSSNCNGLRAIVLDGSNLAMTHGHKEIFSCGGIRECVEFFRHRGHKDIKVFVPHFRQQTPRHDSPIVDQHILLELEKEGVLIWTPSRRIGGRRIVCHDDRYILKTASDKDAVIVSNDEYRDLVRENPEMRRLVEERLLMYSFVDGRFMPPDDPLGRQGPKLDQFLSRSSSCPSAPLCPYGRKCTYGNKCKFFHPERPGGIIISVTDRLLDRAENSKRCQAQMQRTKQPAIRTYSLNPATLNPSVALTANYLSAHQPIVRMASAPTQTPTSLAPGETLFVPCPNVWGSMENSVGPVAPGAPDDGSRCTTFYHLCGLFPEPLVRRVMENNSSQTNPTVLCALCIQAQAQPTK